MKHIIDVTDEEFKDIPITLNGEVLLERTYDNNGKVSGYITIAVDKIMDKKLMTDVELEKTGWDKYKRILDTF